MRAFQNITVAYSSPTFTGTIGVCDWPTSKPMSRRPSRQTPPSLCRRAASFDDARQIGDIAAHAVDAVDDYEAAFPARDPLEDGVQVAGVVVLKAYGLSVGELGAVVDAGVVRLVDNRYGALIEERGDGAEVRLVAGGEDDGRFLVQEARDAVLQLLVQVGAAVEEARAGHRCAELLDRLAGGLHHAGVAGKAQVVVGTEHEDAAAVDLRLRAVVGVQGREEGIDV